MRKSRLGSKTGELRQHERFEIIDFALLEYPAPEDPTRCVIVDVSLGGLQVRSRQPVPVGLECWLRIPMGSGEVVRVRGQVRHSKDVPQTNLIATGIRFTAVTHEERVATTYYVHNVFLRRRERLSG